MSIDVCLRERGVPPRLDQSVIDELMIRPKKKFPVIPTGAPKIDALMADWNSFSAATYSEALEDALDYSREGGFVATAPLLIAAMAMSDDERICEAELIPFSETHLCNIDRNTQEMVFIHGAGLITPEYIRNQEGSDNAKAGYFNLINDIKDLVKGKLPSGESIDMFSIDDVVRGRVPDLFGRYGVVLTDRDIKNSRIKEKFRPDDLEPRIPKDKFLNNPYILATAGSPEYLEAVYNKCENGSFALYCPTESEYFDEIYYNTPGSCGLILDFRAKEGRYLHFAQFRGGFTERIIAANLEAPK